MKRLLAFLFAALVAAPAFGQWGRLYTNPPSFNAGSVAGSTCSFTASGLDNCVIGSVTPAAGTFTIVTASTKYAGSLNIAKTAPTISAGTITLDLSTSNFFNVPLTANVTTTTVSNTAVSGTTSSFTLLYRADGTARTIAWMSGATWINNGGAAPTPSSTSGKCDKYTAFTYDAGTTWYVTVDAQNFTCGA